MPYFVFRGTDRAGAAALRASLREQHRSYIREDRPDCRMVLGGPLLSQSGEAMFATLLVLEAADRDAALRFLADDPYARAGLFASVDLELWSWGFGQPAGGETAQRG